MSFKFYSLTSLTKTADELLFTRHGANDPEFNLRRDAELMIRRKDNKKYTAISIANLQGQTAIFVMSNMDAPASSPHQIEVSGKTYQWTEPYRYFGFSGPE